MKLNLVVIPSQLMKPSLRIIKPLGEEAVVEEVVVVGLVEEVAVEVDLEAVVEVDLEAVVVADLVEVEEVVVVVDLVEEAVVEEVVDLQIDPWRKAQVY